MSSPDDLVEDEEAVYKIIDQLKKNGLFDDLRKQCLSDVDEKLSYTSLRQRVEGTVSGYLVSHQWKPELNKNQLREGVRKHVFESPLLIRGVNHIIDQVLQPKVSETIKPSIDRVIQEFVEAARESQLYIEQYDDSEGFNGDIIGVEVPEHLVDPFNPNAAIYQNAVIKIGDETYTNHLQGLPSASLLASQVESEPNGYENGITEEVISSEKRKKKPEPLTVEDLLNIPLPKGQPEDNTMGKKGDGEEEVQQVIAEEYVIMEEATEHYQVVETGVEDDGAVYMTQEELDEMVPGQAKMYQFAWQNMPVAETVASECSVSSIHTSDLSSFEEDDDDEEEDRNDQNFNDQDEELAEPAADTGAEMVETRKKPKRLISLQYNLSDSDDEETREAHRQRVAQERAERQRMRQQRRAELNERQQRLALERRLKRLQREQKKGSEEKADDAAPEHEAKRPSPRKQKKTKEALKQELREQKVLEKQMALRRHRRVNPKYLSEDFESVFSSSKQLLAPSSPALEATEEVVVEESVITTENETVEEHVVPEEGTYMQVVEEQTEEEHEQDGTILSPSPEPEYMDEMETERTEPVEIQEPDEELDDDQEMCDSQDGPQSPSSRASTPYSEISGSSLESAPAGQDRIEEDISSDENIGEALSENELQEPESRQDSQRYDDTDLYKPRLSLRRHPRGSQQSRTPNSSTDIPEECTHGPEEPPVENQQSTESLLDPEQSDASPKETLNQRSRSRSHTSSRSRSASRHSSRSRSPSHSRSSRSRSKSGRASSSSSHSSGSGAAGSSDESGQERKKRAKVPIHQVSFGQAEKFTRGREPPPYVATNQNRGGNSATNSTPRPNFHGYSRGQGYQRGFTPTTSTPRPAEDYYEGRETRPRKPPAHNAEEGYTGATHRYPSAASPPHSGPLRPGRRRLHHNAPNYHGREAPAFPESPVRTRSSRRSIEEENAPIAKRLRRV